MLSEQHYCPLTGDAPIDRRRTLLLRAGQVLYLLADTAPGDITDEEAARQMDLRGAVRWTQAGGRVHFWGEVR